MAKVVVKSKSKKTKKKFPVEIVAPEFLDSVVLGTSNVSDLDGLVGKATKMNLMYVTGSVKNQNIRLTFRVEDVASGRAVTQVDAYEQIPYYLGRFLKKGSDLVEDSFVVETKDGVKVRVKPFVVTKRSTSQLVLSSIRAKTRELVEAEVAEKKYEEFISSIVSGSVQSSFRNEIRKIYPLKTFEFRKVERE